MKKKIKNTLINIGTGKDYTINYYAKFIKKKVEIVSKINFDKTKPDGVKRKVLNISRAKSYGWKPKISLDEGFEKKLMHHKKINSKMKKIIVVTGGSGFVGSNLIELLLNKTNFKIISIDNYSSGTKKNHLKNSRVKYIKSHTKNISKILFNKKNKIHSFFILENLLVFIKVF